jgi:hypothetical protein
MIVVLASWAFTLNAQIPSYIPTDSLKGWWPFNGNANDESGNGNNGTVNGATLTYDRFGKPDKAYYFDLFDFINTSYLGISGSGARTISFWIKNKYSNRSIIPITYGGENGWRGTVFCIQLNRNYQHDPCNCWPNTIEGPSINGANLQVLYDVSVGDSVNWHHYVYVVEGGNTDFKDVKIYKDGVLISQRSKIIFDYNSNSNSISLNTNLTSNYPLIIGKSEASISSLGSQLDAAPTQFMDDVAFWNRALLASEIKNIYNSCNRWSGTSSFTSVSNWSNNRLPNINDSAIITSGTVTINQTTSIDVITILGGATVRLTAPLTVRNLYIKNGTIDLNGQRLTVSGRIVQSTDSTNYYIQAGTSASPKPRSELIIKPSSAANSTVYFNPNANRLNKFEIGNGSISTQITLGNSIKIKGGEDGGNGPGLLTVNKNAKMVIPSGSTLTLESDTFNAGLSLAQPAQRSIICQGAGKFNIERDHLGVRGWRLYSHPFKTDIDLQEVANDIELIGSGGTAEGFYSNTYTNSAAYWYDYSKADSSAATDPAWTAFTSAKGTTLSGNANKWKKNSPLLLFNPGNRRGTDAFGSPSTATYEQGKIALSYTLDSTAVHLNDGITQSITASNIPSYVQTNGLVGYWPFNGNASDESGNGNHGTISGANLTSDRDGNLFSACEFPNLNDYITTSNGSKNFDSTNQTISFWMKIPQQFNYSSLFLVNNGTYYSDGFFIGLDQNNSAYGNNKYLLVFNIGTGPALTYITDQNTLGNWTNITTSLGNSKMKLYINGAIVDSITYTGKIKSPNNHLIFGDWNNPTTPNIDDRLMDDVVIWNRTLSSSEISSFYNATSTTSNTAKSKYFFITNPFTTPVKLCGIQGLNSSNVDPYFYYWKQRRNTVTDNFSPAEWQSEKIVVGNNTRDSNIAIPAFGTILVRLKNSSSTTFTIPESAKQLTNFGYIIGGAKGVSKTGLMFADATGSDIGPNGVEIKLLVNDSQEADRVLIYNEANQSPAYTNYDAAKYLNQDFPNVYTLSADNKPLSIDMQDIKAQLDAGQPEVVIPLGVNREANKRFATLKWELSENTTGLEIYLKDLQTETTEPWSTGVVKNIALDQQGLTTKRYALVFKQQLSSNENFATIVGQPMIQVYPNPTEDNWVNVVYSKANSKSQYRIFDMAGKQIMHGMANSKFKIDIGSMSKGAYILTIDQNSQFFIKN